MTSQDKRYPALDDTDIMFFGKYENTPLQDIPAEYIKWAWENTGLRNDSKDYHKDLHGFEKHSPWKQRRIKLANYIWNSQDALRLELKDWIFK